MEILLWKQQHIFTWKQKGLISVSLESCQDSWKHKNMMKMIQGIIFIACLTFL